MDKIRKALAALILMLGVLFLLPGKCMAWQLPKQEDEAAFLKWYEENKNTDGAYYRLTGDLYLTQGGEGSPIHFDGQGNVTVDCGGYGILVDSHVNIDNPNIIISGESFFLIMVRSGGVLALNQGTIDYGAQEGAAVDVRNGRLLPPLWKGGMTISAHGSDVTGIYYAMTEETTLSNLMITVEGSVRAKGIDAAFQYGLHVDNCSIQVLGGTKSYGVYAEYAPDIFIRDSRISAEAGETEGEVYSVFNSGGNIRNENSELHPAIPGRTVYQIMETKAGRPVYVEAGQEPAEWQLPKYLDTYAWESDTSTEQVLAIPVEWDMPKKSFITPGYCTVKGEFRTEQMNEEVVNRDNVVPEITVICLPPEKMFLAAYSTFPDESREGIQLLVPYPYDAECLIVEYSLDGQTFDRYAPFGDPNMLVEGETIRKDGLYSFYINVPVPEEGLYIRFLIEGDSMFAGTSGIWKVNRTDDAGIPEHAGGDSSGDRGGQNTIVESPRNTHKKSLENEQAESGKSNVTGGIQGRSVNRADELRKKPADRDEAGHTDDSTDTSPEEQPSGKSAQYVPAPASDKKEENHTGNTKAKGNGGILPVILAVLAGLAAAGIWCGRKAFCKHNNNK